MHCVNEMRNVLIILIYNFLIFIHFTNQIIKQSLAQKLNLIFKFNLIKRQKNIPPWTHMRHKGWRKDGKTFIECYTIALNLILILLYFSNYRSIKIWHLYLKNVKKNNKAIYLRLLFTYLHQNLSNIKKHLALVFKKRFPWTFLCISNLFE